MWPLHAESHSKECQCIWRHNKTLQTMSSSNMCKARLRPGDRQVLTKAYVLQAVKKRRGRQLMRQPARAKTGSSDQIDSTALPRPPLKPLGHMAVQPQPPVLPLPNPIYSLVKPLLPPPGPKQSLLPPQPPLSNHRLRLVHPQLVVPAGMATGQRWHQEEKGTSLQAVKSFLQGTYGYVRATSTEALMM